MVDDQRIDSQETELLFLSTRVSDTVLQHAHAHRHFTLGFLRRFFMMQTSRQEIIRLIEGQGEAPLNHPDGIRLDLFLTSYYLHLAGALDNLAWILAWEFCLKTNLAEDDSASRYFCNLFGNDFLGALSDSHSSLEKYLRSCRKWKKEITEIRDPVAHRIPLSFVRAVLESNEANQYQEKYKRRDDLLEQASKALKQGDVDRALAQVDEAFEHASIAEKLGRFMPIIVTSDAAGRAIRSAENQLEQDHSMFLRISMEVLNTIATSIQA